MAQGSQAERMARLEATLGQLIVWLAQTASQPLSPRDAEALLRKLEGK